MKTVITQYNRAKLITQLQEAPDGHIFDLREPTRSLSQNAALWAALGDVAEQVEWYGKKLTSEDWKHVFSSSLKKQNVVPGLDGGFVVLGISTSKMTIREMSDLLELVYAFGAQQGVRFTASESLAA
jgi:hypothetical protein